MVSSVLTLPVPSGAFGCSVDSGSASFVHQLYTALPALLIRPGRGSSVVVVVGASVVASEIVPSTDAGVVSAASPAFATELANQLRSIDPTEANAEGGGSVGMPSVVGVSVVVVVASSVGVGVVSSSRVIQLKSVEPMLEMSPGPVGSSFGGGVSVTGCGPVGADENQPETVELTDEKKEDELSLAS